MPINQDALYKALGSLSDQYNPDEHDLSQLSSPDAVGNGDTVQNNHLGYIIDNDKPIEDPTDPLFDAAMMVPYAEIPNIASKLAIGGRSLGSAIGDGLYAMAKGPRNNLDRIVPNFTSDFERFSADAPSPNKYDELAVALGRADPDAARNYMTAKGVEAMHEGNPGYLAIDNDGNIAGATSYGMTRNRDALNINTLGAQPGYGANLFDRLQLDAKNFTRKGEPSPAGVQLMPLSKAIPFYESMGMSLPSRGRMSMSLDKDAPRALLEKEHNWFFPND